jgi:hypothetical protein
MGGTSQAKLSVPAPGLVPVMNSQDARPELEWPDPAFDARNAMNAMKISLFVSLVPFLLSACATSQDEQRTLVERLERRNYLLGAPVKEIQDYRLKGWNPLDDRHPIVLTGSKDSCLLQNRTILFVVNIC